MGPPLAVVLMVCGDPVWAAAEARANDSTPVRYAAGGRRDPFVPLVRNGRLVNASPGGSPAEPAKPVLYGVLWDPGGQSIALINDAEAKVGDVIGEYRLRDIRQNSVVLLGSGGEEMVLQISFEKPPSALSIGASKGASGGGEGR